MTNDEMAGQLGTLTEQVAEVKAALAGLIELLVTVRDDPERLAKSA
jgi:hypothetical protein